MVFPFFLTVNGSLAPLTLAAAKLVDIDQSTALPVCLQTHTVCKQSGYSVLFLPACNRFLDTNLHKDSQQ